MLSAKLKELGRRLHPALVAAAACALFLVWWSVVWTAVIGLVLVGIGLSELWRMVWRSNEIGLVHKSVLSVFGTSYLIAVWFAIVFIRDRPGGEEFLLWLIAIAFATDTGAYLVGKLIGRHHMCRNLSPGKTWEGTIGGVVCGTVVGSWILWEYYLRHNNPDNFMMGVALIIPFAIAVVSVIGDLLESALKRDCGEKDSGTIFGAHGGALDRFDSYFLVAVAVAGFDYAIQWL